ncbi:MAG: hypothetical protein JXR34_10705 [Bacteroidales bacterium]|nr:hypothetical protein [Bacteroidales bacterium]
MRRRLIKTNFLLSLFALTIDPDHSSFTAVLIAFSYFIVSALLFNYASEHGWLENNTAENK